MVYQERVARLAALLPQDTAALIRSPENRLYFTGQKTTAGALAVTRDKAYLIADFRYYERMQAALAGCANIEVVRQGKLYPQLGELLQKHAARQCYIELEKTVYSEVRRLRERLPALSFAEEDWLDQAITGLRACKDPQEQKKIIQAQELADRAFSHITQWIKPGMAEREIALELEFFSRRLGSEENAFDYIVVSGPNTALPHGTPGERRVCAGDFITMDFGCTVSGYRSDMTRTVALGKITPEQDKVYRTVLDAQQTALAAYRPGLSCALADKAARDVIDNAGFAGCFGHSLGHGVGIDIHEPPFVGQSGGDTLQPGMAVTCEPGIYLPGRFGVRIEDMGFVTESGFDDITRSPKELIIL